MADYEASWSDLKKTMQSWITASNYTLDTLWDWCCGYDGMSPSGGPGGDMSGPAEFISRVASGLPDEQKDIFVDRLISFLDTKPEQAALDRIEAKHEKGNLFKNAPYDKDAAALEDLFRLCGVGYRPSCSSDRNQRLDKALEKIMERSGDRLRAIPRPRNAEGNPGDHYFSPIGMLAIALGLTPREPESWTAFVQGENTPNKVIGRGECKLWKLSARGKVDVVSIIAA